MRPTDLDPAFISHAPGYWSDEDTANWDDHRWQLRNRVDLLADLDLRLNLTDEERAGVLLAGNKLAMSITKGMYVEHCWLAISTRFWQTFAIELCSCWLLAGKVFELSLITAGY